MVRKAAVVLSLLTMLVSTQVYAVRLGNITLDSSFNQPFSARIEIFDLGNVAIDEITITLASPEDFDRFNANRYGFLLNIQYAIEATSAGVFVNLTTNQPVRDPFLSFILDTRWSSGRILSEHTVLLDLPVFAEDSAVEPISQPISASSVLESPQGVVQRAQPVNRAPSPAAPINPAPVQVELEPEVVEQQPDTTPAPIETLAPVEANVLPAPETIEVQSSDTLWEVALRVRPDASVSVQQTMLAIQRLNPEAFADGNINLLRAGETLQVPDLSDIQSFNQQQAVSEVVRQNQQANIGVEPLAASASGPSAADTAQQGQLSVITAEDAEVPTNQPGGDIVDENETLDAMIQALENQLAIGAEEADRARLQQEQLISRLDDLGAQIASAMEIITLQDLQLAQLQQSLAEASVQPTEQAALVEPLAEREAELTVSAEQPQPLGMLENIMQIISNSFLVLVGVVILVVLLLVTLLLRRSKNANADFENGFDELAEVDELAIEEGSSSPIEESLDKDRFNELIDVDEELEQTPATFEIETTLFEPEEELAEDELVEEFDADVEAEDVSYYDLESFEEEITTGDNDSIDIDEVETTEKAVDDIEVEAEQEIYEEIELAFEDGTDEKNEETDQEVEEESESIIALDETGEVKKPEEEEIDFDLDELLSSAGIDTESSDAISADTVDFDLAEFEDEVEEPGDQSNTEIPEEVEDFNADDIGSNTEVMFDLADSGFGEEEVEDTEFESIEDENTLEFSADDSTDIIAPDNVDLATQTDKNTAVESVNFDVTDIKLPDDIDASSKLGSDLADEATEAEESKEEPDTESIDFAIAAKPKSNVGTTVQVDPTDADELPLQNEEIELGEKELEFTEAVIGGEIDNEEVEEDAVIAENEADELELSDDKSDETQNTFEVDSIEEIEEDAESSVASGLDELQFLATDAQTEIEETEDEFDFLSDEDEAATKLDLAYAYQKMGDVDGAREILEEVVSEGNDSQVSEAKNLLATLD